MKNFSIFRLGCFLGLLLSPSLLGAIPATYAGEPSAKRAKSEQAALAARGYELLTSKAYVNSLYTGEMFDQLWQVWDVESKKIASGLSPEERRRMAFERYGLTARPGESVLGLPLQYNDNGEGGWTMNCLACHGGKVAGETTPGAPNTLFAMQTLREEVRAFKFSRGTYTAKDVAATLFPLGNSIGTTNAVMFGVALASLRDADLNLIENTPVPRMVHHDMDAPPFWNVKKKKRLYIDAFAPNDHRATMQFAMIPENSGEQLKAWEDDYRAIYAWILTTEAPRYRWPIDQALAAQGHKIFLNHCAECHGTYGTTDEEDTYPNRVVPIDEIGTDRVRYDALSQQGKVDYAHSWFARDAAIEVDADSPGYIAPPLDGVWASAPYFHNGSVPTLWHVLHPDERPAVWKRTIDGYDTDRVGLEVETMGAIPAQVRDSRERRRYFDTRLFSKSSAGHDYPSALTEAEKHAVLEYLKTL